MFRRSLCAVFMVSLLILIACPAMAAPKVILDDQQISFDVAPIIDNNRTMVPLRTILEELGAEVSWDDYTKTVTAVKDNMTIKLEIGNNNALINEQTVQLDVPGKIVSGRTMIPLRFVSEAFGASVHWNPAENLINISGAQPQKQVAIGLNLELTGGVAAYGNSLNNGVQLALKDNQDLGLAVVTADCQSNANKAYEASQKLLKNSIIAQIGPLTSGNVTACIPLFEDSRIPLLAPVATSPDITVNHDTGQTYNNIFRVCFKDPLQGNLMAAFVRNELKAQTCVIIRDSTSDYSTSLTKSFKTSFMDAGGQVVLEQGYNFGDTDFTEILERMKKQKFDFIYMPGYYQEVGLILKQARAMGIDQPIGGGDGWDSPSIVTLAGAQALNNTYFVNHFCVDDPNDRVVKFVGKYKESYGKLPDAFAALGYDSAMMLCKAIRASQSYNPEAIRASLAKMKDFIGVTGKIIMDKEHNPIKPGVIMEFKDGQKVFKMRILSDVKNQSSIPSSPETSEVTTEEPSIAEMIKDAREYSSHFPAFKVTCDNNEITWIRGDANFTGKAGGRVGNTCFGADEVIADKALKAVNVKPGSLIKLEAAEVPGLNKPEYKIYLYDKIYTSNQNQLAAPQEVGEYLFLCHVDWGNGDNEITYWLKIRTLDDDHR